MLRAVKYLLVAAAVLLVPRVADAGGFGIPEVGARRTAMAAVVGRPDEPSAIFHNPAGLTLLPGMRVYATFGLSLLDTEFKLRPWDCEADACRSDELLEREPGSDGYYDTTRPTRAMGAIPMLTLSAEILPGKLWGAIGAYVSNGTGAAFAEDDVTRYHLIDGYIISPTMTAVAAYQVTPEIAVGAGAGMMKVLVKGRRYLYPIVNGRDVRNVFGTRPELELEGEDWAFTWNAGIVARPIPKLTLGATVIGRVDPELVGPVTLTYGDDSPTPGEQLNGFAITGLVLPWTFFGGANYDVTPNLELGTEGRYYLYRSYKEQYTRLNNIPFASELRTPKNYGDSWQIAGGARLHGLRQLPHAELMIGGHYDKTPAPPQTVTLDQPTFTHIGLHGGVRWQVGRYRLAATYIHYWYRIPRIEDSLTTPPSNIQGEGGNDIFTVSIEAELSGGALVSR